IGGCFFWMFFPSHYLRKKGLNEIGCSNFHNLRENIKQLKTLSGKGNFSLIIGFMLLLYILFSTKIVEVTQLIPFLGIINKILTNTSYSFFIFILATIEYLILMTIGLMVLLKTDNIKESFILHLKLFNPFIIFLVILTAIGFPERLEEVTFVNAISYFFGYIFWAFIQQIPFLGYVHTHVREGLERHDKFKNERLRNFSTALITAGLFSIVHFPAWELSVIAFIMEFLLSLAFFNKETRNMFIACVFHAFIGTIIVYFWNIDLLAGYLALFK
ncbi:MAG: hypothetical protein ACTSXU_03190, partial [Promethearchaeota archaeon]